MSNDHPDTHASPWHAGEKRLQEIIGVAERMEAFGNKVIRDYMPDQHRQFYQQLPFIVVGAVDSHGRPWASLLEGPVGFAYSPDPTHLRLNAHLASADPAASGVRTGESLGLLGIELHTRRRNRLNGCIVDSNNDGLTVKVQHAFGNCPQYIQLRDFSFSREPGAPSSVTSSSETPSPATASPSTAAKEAAEVFSVLDAAAQDLISAADTFFVASYADLGAPGGQRGVDVSHRGGKPGFVRVDGNTLTIPDFAGNKHFNTLGNLWVNPQAGLLFVDFSNGDVLQLTGDTEILFDGPDVHTFQGAERVWKVHVKHIVRRRNALALRWQFNEMSPKSLQTGSWQP